MNKRLESGLSFVLTLAAVVMAAGIVKREFFSETAVAATAAATSASFVDNWRDALPVGVSLADSKAPIKIVEFSDLECPSCRSFHHVLGEVLKERRGTVDAVFVHFPLSQHRFARPAARAAECAAVDGSFARFVGAIYDKQDSLGLRSWGAFARDAGIQDTARIAKCASASGKVARIDDGLAFGNKIGALFTPTVMINGWRLGTVPSKEELNRIIEALVQGKKPFDTTGKATTTS
jgi:protein-disulfide isomerase